MIELSVEILVFLVLAAFVSGFVDAIAGGGGLIVVPSLLLAGLGPVEALATNKLQGLFGSGSAALSFSAKGHVKLSTQWPLALIAFIAAGLGAMAVSLLPTDAIRPVLPFLLIAIALFFWLKPGLDDRQRVSRLTPLAFAMTVVPLVGFYDGLFGPGAGSFYMLGFVLLAGHGILKATAHTKLLNFASNVGGFVVFAFAGSVLWKLGLIMGVAQIVGASLGARFAMKNGAKIIKPMLVFVCLALATRLLLSG